MLEALERTLERIKAVERERDALRASSMATEVAELLSLAADGVVIASVIGRSADELRSMAGDILRRGSLRGVALGSVVEDKVALAVATDGALDAKAVVKVVGPLIGGGGGGSSVLAVAGGKRPEGLVEALDEASTLLGGA